ncbi:methyltransferase domain-containing protein [Azoarcus indigens]|uniref:Methyltransferase family protein n=1 Tax=Azoarcus indigens TaxID=29545 RepID=A0A4R6E6U3_9RHOO|nr:class I SAM-dependent methyltransferase [Azoarcus indigens]NMG64057.1 methyltransferase domain-containing protein [Azoarcus indigens]TDN53667.1 methyltransferase family protein [Azoarcus indigens]
MNTPHSDGYQTGLPYPAYFHRELTPGWLATTVTALGHRAPPLSGPYTWCELGCGPGLTTLIAAASNPAGTFYGVDFDAAAIAHARALAAESGLDNAHFLQLSFAELVDAGCSPLPPLDFVVLHGVLSWISPANRQAVMRIIENRLKPGGIACLAYMSQPGSAPMMAMQRVLQRSARLAGAAPGLESGLALLRGLRDGGAGQFAVVPELSRQLDEVMRHPQGYLAHEFLGAHWEPLHVADVMAAAESAGCGFLGSATPLENIDAVSLPGGTQATIGAIADTALRETAKDIARNQTLRRDLYQRGPQPLTVAEHRAALEAQRLRALPGAPRQGALRFDTRIGPVNGPAAMFSPLLEALADGEAQRFGELLRLPAYAGSRGGLLNQASQMLYWAGHLHPCPATAPDPAPAQALNRAILRAVAAGGDYPGLAAPAIGAGIPAPRDSLLAALAWLKPDLPAAAAVPAAVRTHFRHETLPAWQRLGALPASPSN